jgi:hypothetical protein
MGSREIKHENIKLIIFWFPNFYINLYKQPRNIENIKQLHVV